MRGLALLAAFGLLSLGTVGCERDDRLELGKELNKIEKRLAGIEKQIKEQGIGGARGAGGDRGRPTPPRRRPRGPDPSKTYAVPIEGDPSVGPEHAKVTLIKAFEFACPYCYKVNPTLDQLRKDYGNDLKIVYKDYVVHPGSATTPALATCAAHKQGKYKPMEELVWEKGFKAGRNLSQENMEKLAGELQLDMKKFKADMEGPCKQEIQKDQRELAQFGMRGTPGFFINGRFLSGARPIDQFKKLIDEELKKANERVGKGTKLKDYYDKWVLEEGEKRL